MDDVILTETEYERKIFNIINSDINIRTEYKMNNEWFFDTEMALTAKEFNMIFDIITK